MVRPISKPVEKMEVRDWRAELEAAAAETVADLPAVAGDWLSTEGGKLGFRGTPLEGSKGQFIILDFLNENQCYAKPYVRGQFTPPSCYAFGRKKDAMAPHANVTEPQANRCKGCPNLEWGTADTGKGKKCKEVVRLALIPAVSTADDVEESEVAYLKIPVMSVKNFSNFADQLNAALHLPPFAVATEISVNSDNQVTVLFKLVEPVAEELLPAIMEKRKLVKLDNPYPEAGAAPTPTTPASRPATSRFSGAKKL